MRSVLGILLLAAAVAPLLGQAVNVEAEREAIRNADLELARAVADRQLERFLQLAFSLKWSPTQVEVAQCGDMGYSVGSYERVAPDAAGKPAVATGTYVTIWRKQPDGRWRAVLNAGTPGVPRPAASGETRNGSARP